MDGKDNFRYKKRKRNFQEANQEMEELFKQLPDSESLTKDWPHQNPSIENPSFFRY